MPRQVFCIVTLALCGLACSSERPVSEYPTLRAAEAAGALRRGWIPEGIPDSAYSLWEQHDLDTNQVFLRIELPRAARPALVDGLRLRELSSTEVDALDFARPWARTRWLELEPTTGRARLARIYVTASHANPMFVASEQQSESVFVWSTSR